MARTELSDRESAVLRAVSVGRCTVTGEVGTPLTIDGYCLSDQFAGSRLTEAGLITASGPTPALARLTPTGEALLRAA
jgi:hypothetical protein